MKIQESVKNKRFWSKKNIKAGVFHAAIMLHALCLVYKR